MFCDGCGAAVQPGQSYCSRCGKQILGPAMMQAHRNRVQEHIHLLAVLWYAISALTAVGGIVLLIIANTLFPHLHDMGAPQEVPAGFLTSLLSVVAILILAKASCGFIAGWGLMKREPWGRVLTLVLGFISLINIPFGTALGVYTLWVLLPGQSQQEYDTMVTAAQAA